MNFFCEVLSFFRKHKRPDNTGVLVGNQATDYFVGANSPIEYKERLRDGNWNPYAFDQEPQYSNPSKPGFLSDNMGCVSNSIINSIQGQELFITGKKIQYSKRWLAKMSGTTKEGNYLYKVADAIRKYGLVLEEDYPTPKTPWSFEDYYADIPAWKMDELLGKGQDWLRKWNFQYEFLAVTDPNLDYHLKHSPIQIVIPGHAVCGIHSPTELAQFLDSYPPYFKTYPVNGLQQAMKGILTPKTILAREIAWDGSPELGLYLPFDSMQRRDLIRQKLSEWLPDYVVDASKTYQVPAKKPNWN